ncbi:hypothetical protein ACH4PU_30200 [Streptomyces sp. NPDC021100]|uniref:hypothetical protein n=1 Tax=Streptomyces sp. NPDC021100 TaxID=3365114 RepID=UPI0037ADCB7C
MTDETRARRPRVRTGAHRTATRHRTARRPGAGTLRGPGPHGRRRLPHGTHPYRKAPSWTYVN